MELYRVYHLQCARRLPALPETHPCSRVHGHSFRIELRLRGALDPVLGWVCDFAEIDAVWAQLHARLDHRYLNDLPGLANPTSENFAVWLWSELTGSLPEIVEIRVGETHESGCIYRGNLSQSCQ